MKLRVKLSAQLWTASGLTFSGTTLLFMGFWVNPAGVIDHSVLVAFGEVCTFAGGLFGVDYTYKIKRFKHKGEDEDDKKDK
ncbi:hypothetical protein EZS27_024436 [termite gut metagenome]|jgi:hypothetical protein|uniref:Uncharacterized protein n=1 Tax=termite gut metagenome TaxID=433724 RepID=A0A5J4QZS1_9ZZZZ